MIFVAETNEISEVFPDLLWVGCGEVSDFLPVATDGFPVGPPTISEAVVCVKRDETRQEVVWIARQSILGRGAKVVVAVPPRMPQLVHLDGVIVNERDVRSFGKYCSGGVDPLVNGPDDLRHPSASPVICPCLVIAVTA